MTNCVLTMRQDLGVRKEIVMVGVLGVGKMLATRSARSERKPKVKTAKNEAKLQDTKLLA